jgi:hypothetical protein
MPLKAEKPTDLLPAEPTPIVNYADVQPLDMQALFEKAMDMGPAGAEVLERLTKLKHDIDDRHAHTAFAEAMVGFQSECPPISKSTTAEIKTERGANYQYKYAELPEIARTIQPYRTKYGLSHGWRTEDDDKGKLWCICIIRHRAGHKEETAVPCPTGTLAKMSEAQKCGSALTYFRRQSMILGYGLTTCDPDDDGAGGTAAHEPISEDQAKKLYSYMQDVRCDFEKFYAFFDIQDVKELPVSRYDEAMCELDKKRERQEKQNG